jgi:hypothetical protein
MPAQSAGRTDLEDEFAVHRVRSPHRPVAGQLRFGLATTRRPTPKPRWRVSRISAAKIISSTITLKAAGAGVPTQPHNLSKIARATTQVG